MGLFHRWLGQKPGVPADIAGLITALGVTPLGVFDARYGPTTASWPDARGGSHPSAIFSGGTPTFTGSGVTRTVSWTSAVTCLTAASIPVPAAGVSVLYVGSLHNNGFAATWQSTAPSYLLAGVGVDGSSHIIATAFTSTTALIISSGPVASGSTIRAMAMSNSWAGAGAITVDAGAQATGSLFTLTPTGSGQLVLAIGQVAADVQAAIFIPGLYTSGQMTSFLAWATANHTYT